MKHAAIFQSMRSLNFMIGALISLGFVFVSFEWSHKNITVFENETDNAVYFAPIEQIPVTVMKDKPVKRPLPNFSLENMVVVEEIYLEIDDNISLIDEPDNAITGDDINPEAFDYPEIIDDVVPIAEIMPAYPGGYDALYSFLANNIQYPAFASEMNIQGKVFVSFVIEKDGSVSSINLTKGLDDLLDEEAKRVIAMMPNWKPGIQNGKKVRVKMVLPINFVLK